MDSDDDSDRFDDDGIGKDDEAYLANLQNIKENNPLVTEFVYPDYLDLTSAGWARLGRAIANNTYLKDLKFNYDNLDDHKASFFFRGLIRSASIKYMHLHDNGISVEGIRSMVPFLQNANNLTMLDLDDNNLQSEGFNVLFQALRDSSIERLFCNRCGIESIEIDNDYFPRHLEFLQLDANSINSGGCRALAKLLQGRDATLTCLWLRSNKIDDEGVAILVDALQSNTSLKELNVRHNDGISIEGAKLCLRLVNDISTTKKTLQSNHTLQILTVKYINYDDDDDVNSQIHRQIDNALEINRDHENDPEAAGREKVIQTQLRSEARTELANLQGVDRSLYSEINPLHLPEVLALVGHHHGQGELYLALKSSIAGVISTVNRKECIQQQMAHYAARLEELGAELAAINEAEGDTEDIGSESRSNKRRRA